MTSRDISVFLIGANVAAAIFMAGAGKWPSAAFNLTAVIFLVLTTRRERVLR